jgi:hypothetical protein
LSRTKFEIAGAHEAQAQEVRNVDLWNSCNTVGAQVTELRKRCLAEIDKRGAKDRFDLIDVEVDPQLFAREAVDVVIAWLQSHPSRKWIANYHTLSGVPYIRFGQKR